MKRNTGITRKKSSVVLAATVSLLAAAPPALADWLDVIAESITVTNVRTGQSGTTVSAQVGDSLQIVCTEWVGLYAGHDFWQTKTVQGWEDRVTVDSQVIAIFNPTIAPGTMIGHKEASGGFVGLGGSMAQNGLDNIRNIYPPVSWIAAGAGNHVTSCVLNQPKKVSDHVATNNVANALIVVAAAPQTPQANPPVSMLPTTATGTVAESVPNATRRSAGSVRSTAEPVTAATGIRTINAGSAEPANATGSAQDLTAAGGIRAMNGKDSNSVAPPNPCRADVSYYVPEVPVLVTNGTALQVNDQLQIQCTFKKVTRNIEWQNCDAAARSATRVLKQGQQTGSRYSGIVSIDDGTVGVSTSPQDGSDFENLKLWKFDTPGTHDVSCQIDNAFRFATEGEEAYLKAAVSVDVSARSDGLTYRGFEPANATTLQARPTASGANPRLQGLTRESVTPVARQPVGNDRVNPSPNRRPEVAPSRQSSGNDIVNPPLKPQPEVPSRRLEPDGATVSPKPAPLPDPPSPNIGDNAPDNFTGAARQDLNRTFDPQEEFAAVRLSQGSVAMSNDMNDAGVGRTNASYVAAVLVIEAESLIGTAAISGGQMVRQEMAGFGAGWGGNAQLFWRPPTPAGSKPHLLTEFVLSSAGTYDVMLHYTTAPDFGQFTVYIDGTNSTRHDGYGSQIGLRQALLGRYQLASGRHELAFEVTGKSQQSTGYIVGVDRLQLTTIP